MCVHIYTVLFGSLTVFTLSLSHSLCLPSHSLSLSFSFLMILFSIFFFFLSSLPSPTGSRTLFFFYISYLSVPLSLTRVFYSLLSINSTGNCFLFLYPLVCLLPLQCLLISSLPFPLYFPIPHPLPRSMCACVRVFAFLKIHLGRLLTPDNTIAAFANICVL